MFTGTQRDPDRDAHTVTNGTAYDLQIWAISWDGDVGFYDSDFVEVSGTPTAATTTTGCAGVTLASPANEDLSLALTAGGNAVTVRKRTDSEVHWHATVPYDTSQVTVTPTWTHPACVTGTVQSRDYPSDANGHTWPVLTAETAVTSGDPVTVNLASGNPDVHDPTSVTIVLTRAPRYSKAYHLEVTQGGEIEASLSVAPANVMEGGKGDGDGDAVAAGSGGAGHAHTADLLGRRGPGRGLAHRSGRKRLLGHPGPVHPRQDAREDGDAGHPDGR